MLMTTKRNGRVAKDWIGQFLNKDTDVCELLFRTSTFYFSFLTVIPSLSRVAFLCDINTRMHSMIILHIRRN